MFYKLIFFSWLFLSLQQKKTTSTHHNLFSSFLQMFFTSSIKSSFWEFFLLIKKYFSKQEKIKTKFFLIFEENKILFLSLNFFLEYKIHLYLANSYIVFLISKCYLSYLPFPSESIPIFLFIIFHTEKNYLLSHWNLFFLLYWNSKEKSSFLSIYQ